MIIILIYDDRHIKMYMMTKLQGMKSLIGEVCATASALATGQTLAKSCPPKSKPIWQTIISEVFPASLKEEYCILWKTNILMSFSFKILGYLSVFLLSQNEEVKMCMANLKLGSILTPGLIAGTPTVNE